MKIERMIGVSTIARRLAGDMEKNYPLSRHVFPDTSFLLFGPTDCGGEKPKPSRK